MDRRDFLYLGAMTGMAGMLPAEHTSAAVLQAQAMSPQKEMASGFSVRSICDYLIKLTAHGAFNKDEGLQFGNPEKKVERIVLCWMADKDAIEFAAKEKADLIIVHESLFYPYDVVVNGGISDFMAWRVNYERICRLAAADIAVIRFHMSLDIYNILDVFARQLGLGQPAVTRNIVQRRYDIPPVTYAGLIEKVKTAVNIPLIRATMGDPQRIVSKVGLAWGGLGIINNIGHSQALIDLGCDVIIAGETDNYSIRFVKEAGLDMIETSHEVSENFGLSEFAGVLRQDLKGVNSLFYENKMPYHIV